LKESSDAETLMTVGIWFQICVAAEEKTRHPVGFYPENMQKGLARGMKSVTGLVERYMFMERSRLLSRLLCSFVK